LSRHRILLWKTMQKPKKQMSTNQIQIRESVTGGEDISTPTMPV